jgi:DNA-binding FrmR family transcriptional regulator
MQFEEQATLEAIRRLRRVEGQIGGIVRMLEEGRDCKAVVQQLSAANRALDRAGVKLLAGQLRHCIASDAEEYDPAEVEELFISLG